MKKEGLVDPLLIRTSDISDWIIGIAHHSGDKKYDSFSPKYKYCNDFCHNNNILNISVVLEFDDNQSSSCHNHSVNVDLLHTMIFCDKFDVVCTLLGL